MGVQADMTGPPVCCAPTCAGSRRRHATSTNARCCESRTSCACGSCGKNTAAKADCPSCGTKIRLERAPKGFAGAREDCGSRTQVDVGTGQSSPCSLSARAGHAAARRAWYPHRTGWRYRQPGRSPPPSGWRRSQGRQFPKGSGSRPGSKWLIRSKSGVCSRRCVMFCARDFDRRGQDAD